MFCKFNLDLIGLNGDHRNLLSPNLVMWAIVQLGCFDDFSINFDMKCCHQATILYKNLPSSKKINFSLLRRIQGFIGIFSKIYGLNEGHGYVVMVVLFKLQYALTHLNSLDLK